MNGFNLPNCQKVKTSCNQNAGLYQSKEIGCLVCCHNKDVDWLFLDEVELKVCKIAVALCYL